MQDFIDLKTPPKIPVLNQEEVDLIRGVTREVIVPNMPGRGNPTRTKEEMELRKQQNNEAKNPPTLNTPKSVGSEEVKKLMYDIITSKKHELGKTEKRLQKQMELEKLEQLGARVRHKEYTPLKKYREMVGSQKRKQEMLKQSALEASNIKVVEKVDEKGNVKRRHVVPILFDTPKIADWGKDKKNRNVLRNQRRPKFGQRGKGSRGFNRGNRGNNSGVTFKDGVAIIPKSLINRK